MKRILLLLVCSAGLWCAAEAQYRIYAYEGSVFYKMRSADKTASWSKVQNNLLLETLDSLRICKGGSIRLEYIRTHMIYTAAKSGTWSVNALVEDAKNENARHIGKAVSREIMSGSSATIPMLPMATFGSGSREIMMSSDSLELLADMFAWIGTQACSQASDPKAEGLALIKRQVGDEWDFGIENATRTDYYINVVHIHQRTQTASLCYVVTPDVASEGCLFLPAGNRVETLGILFPNTEEDSYVLVATERAYDTYALDNELIYHPIDDAKSARIPVVYQW